MPDKARLREQYTSEGILRKSWAHTRKCEPLGARLLFQSSFPKRLLMDFPNALQAQVHIRTPAI